MVKEQPKMIYWLFSNLYIGLLWIFLFACVAAQDNSSFTTLTYTTAQDEWTQNETVTTEVSTFDGVADNSTDGGHANSTEAMLNNTTVGTQTQTEWPQTLTDNGALEDNTTEDTNPKWTSDVPATTSTAATTTTTPTSTTTTSSTTTTTAATTTTTTETPDVKTTPQGAESSTDGADPGPNSAAIAAGVCIPIVVVIAVAVTLYLYFKKKACFKKEDVYEIGHLSPAVSGDSGVASKQTYNNDGFHLEMDNPIVQTVQVKQGTKPTVTNETPDDMIKPNKDTPILSGGAISSTMDPMSNDATKSANDDVTKNKPANHSDSEPTSTENEMGDDTKKGEDDEPNVDRTEEDSADDVMPVRDLKEEPETTDSDAKIDEMEEKDVKQKPSEDEDEVDLNSTEQNDEVDQENTSPDDGDVSHEQQERNEDDEPSNLSSTNNDSKPQDESEED